MIAPSQIDKKEFNKWLTALYSDGEFKQGKGALQPSKDTFCCLGVACKVLIPASLQLQGEEGYLNGALPSAQGHAPLWLRRINSDFYSMTQHAHLADLNDSGDYSFAEIADLLYAVHILEVLK